MPAKKFIYALLVLAVFTLSCKKKQVTPDPQPQPDKPFVTDVYTVGFKVVSNHRYGIFWKNGLQVSITDDLNSSINAVTAVGADVYMAGHTSAGAVYWKNGQPVILAPGTSCEAFAIAVSGTDVYAGGQVYVAGDTYGRAAYWKNGVETDLTDGSVPACVYAIAVSGADVYMAGQYNVDLNGVISAFPVAACWKNQTPVPLDGAVVPAYGSYGKGIAVKGADVYVTGYIEFGAALWKNGSLQPLDDNSGYPLDTFGFGVALNGTDVYVTGEHGNQAAYWKNGTIKDLISGAYVASGVQSICFQGNDVYMGGYMVQAPVYWKNDTTRTLQNNGEPYSVNGIAVSRHQ
jgi:hypothetical protein